MKEIVIKIPDEAKQAFDDAESNELKGGFYDHGGVIANAIRNGKVLPKGHGRLIDADALKAEWKEGFHKKIVDALMDDAPTLVEADKGDEE